MKPLVYLASPYKYRGPEKKCIGTTYGNFPIYEYQDSHRIEEERYQAAIDASAWLMSQGWIVHSPIVATHPIAVKHKLPLGSEYWMQFDEVILAKCDEMIILMIDGVFESPGVKKEFKINREAGKNTRLLIPLNGPETGKYRIQEMDWEIRECLE